jgi:hypothetical protein
LSNLAPFFALVPQSLSCHVGSLSGFDSNSLRPADVVQKPNLAGLVRAPTVLTLAVPRSRLHTRDPAAVKPFAPPYIEKAASDWNFKKRRRVRDGMGDGKAGCMASWS